MVDLLTYRMRIGIFCRTVDTQNVTKKARVMLQNLKRYNRPNKILQLSVHLCLGTILFFGYIVGSPNNGFADHTVWKNNAGLNYVFSEDKRTVPNAIMLVKITEFYCQTFILHPVKSYKTVIMYQVHPRHFRISTAIPIQHNNFARRVPFNVLILYATIVKTKMYDIFLGNKGAHLYYGNPKREVSPVPGPSSSSVWKLHNKMVDELGELIAPSLDYEWRRFIQQFNRPDLLSPVEIKDIKDIFDLFSILISKGKIRHGKYETVKTILLDLQLIQCLDIVKTYETKMRQHLQDNNEQDTKKPRPEVTTDEDTKKPRPEVTTDEAGKLNAKITTPGDKSGIGRQLLETIMTNYNQNLQEISNSPETTVEERVKIWRDLTNETERSFLLTKKMMQELKQDGITPLTMSSGSLNLPFSFHSRQSVRSLWYMYTSGYLLHLLHEGLVTPIVLKECNVETINLEVFISQLEYEECSQYLVQVPFLEESVTMEQSVEEVNMSPPLTVAESHSMETYHKKGYEMKPARTEEMAITLANQITIVGEELKLINQMTARTNIFMESLVQHTTELEVRSRGTEKIVEQLTAMGEEMKSFRANMTRKTEDMLLTLDLHAESSDEEIITRHELGTRTEDMMAALARHAALFGESDLFYEVEAREQTPSENKMPTEDMALCVGSWKPEDKSCYVTKGIKHVLQMLSETHNYVSVIGKCGSGKSTTLKHVALYFEKINGYTIYPITRPDEFFDFFDERKLQLFVIDDVIGEYFVDDELLRLWELKNEEIKACLDTSNSTKFLTSLRIQLNIDPVLQGKTYIFNDHAHITSLNDKRFRLSQVDMKNMLQYSLEARCINNIEGVIKNICSEWTQTFYEEIVDCFPLHCKIISENEMVRMNPKDYFSDALLFLSAIFRKIKEENPYQFCGLLLTGVTEFKDEYVSPVCKTGLPRCFSFLVKSLNLDPEKDLLKIREALLKLNGVFISHVGNRYRFSHSIFKSIVIYLYDDEVFVFKHATCNFIESRVRFFNKMDTDDEYVLVYKEECVDLMVQRMIHELMNHRGWGAAFIVNNPNIDNNKLISPLINYLFASNNADIKQDMINMLFCICIDAVWQNKKLKLVTSGDKLCPGYKLLTSLISRADCNTQIPGAWGGYAIHLSVDAGLLSLSKLLVKHNADVNALDGYNRSVLHFAAGCKNNVRITRYLLSINNIACFNQTDIWNKTPYWYIVNNKRPALNGKIEDWDIPCKDIMIKIYTQTNKKIFPIS